MTKQFQVQKPSGTRTRFRVVTRKGHVVTGEMAERRALLIAEQWNAEKDGREPNFSEKDRYYLRRERCVASVRATFPLLRLAAIAAGRHPEDIAGIAYDLRVLRGATRGLPVLERFEKAVEQARAAASSTADNYFAGAE